MSMQAKLRAHSGEYAGLIAIGQIPLSLVAITTETFGLIPSSAHGTNPASAALAGLKVGVYREMR